MRVALGQGFHSDMPPEYLGEKAVERGRKIWWTVYVLDREMTCLMGQPQSIHDDDIRTRLPQTSMSPSRVAALDMHIRICRCIASVGRGIYGANGRLHEKFLLSTKSVLASVAGLADELQKQFPLDIDNNVNGVTRTSGYLHLLYHQVGPRPHNSNLSPNEVRQLLTLAFHKVRCTCDASFVALLPEDAI